jgi:hypothetical protein
MPISIFPAPSTAAGGPDAKIFQIAAAFTTYEINDTFLAGGYTVTTSPATVQVRVQFINASSVLADQTTVSGTISFKIESAATQVYITDASNATSTTVTITYTSQNASGSALSGTLDTITSTQAYNQTGLLYPVVVSGGGGGRPGSGNGGGGGGGGGISGKILFTNSATTATIGVGGAQSTDGGASSFGNLISVNGGKTPGVNNPGAGGASGTPGSATGGDGNITSSGASGSVNTTRFTSVVAGTNGGGGGGAFGNNGSGGAGAGSGIGTGGSGGNTSNSPNLPNAGNAGTGYGAGGGGGGRNNNSETNAAGAAGTSGVIYVLRGF